MKASGDKRTSVRREMRAASLPTGPLDERPQTRGSEFAPKPSRSIEIHINELVLHGFAHADRRPIAESVERELRTLLNEDFSNATSLAVARIAGGSFQLESNRRHESAGTNIARAIYGGLRQ